MRAELNVTCGTDVVLNVRLLFKGVTFDASLSSCLEANLISGLGRRTALPLQLVDDELVVTVPWVTGRHPGRHGLELRGMLNGLRWRTVADGLINYTRATVPGTTPDVTVTADTYDITMEVAYRYGATPIERVEASVDGGVGTPSVDVSYVSRVLSLSLHNLKGDPGDEGKSAYEVAVENGFSGTEAEWLASLRGETGKKGDQGDSAIFDPQGKTVDVILANVLGNSTVKGMTQKAITESVAGVKAIEWQEEEPTRLAHLHIDDTGNVNSSTGDYRYVYYIPVNDGDAVKVTASHGTGTSLPYIAVALYDNIPADGESARQLLDYVNADASEGRIENLYLMNAGGYLAVGIYGSSAALTVKKNVTAKDILEGYKEEIDAISEMVDGEKLTPTEDGSEDYDYTTTNNYYINKNGSAVALSGNKMKYTSPVKVLKGDLITYSCDGSSSGNNATLSEVITDGVSYTPLIVDKLQYAQRTYLVPKDMFVAFSYRYDTHPDLDIVINRNGMDIRLSALETQLQFLPNVDSNSGWAAASDENPLKSLISGPSLVRTFKSYGIIGASFETGYTNGRINGESSQFYDVGYEWPTLMAKVNTVEVRNYAWPGHWLNLWLNGCGSMNVTGENMHNFTADEPPCECYIVNMSSNDVANGKYTGSVGETTIDVNIRYDEYDFSETQPWEIVLAAIIQKLRAKSPKCYIMMATVRKYSGGRDDMEDMLQAMKDIAELFDNVFILDINTYGFDWPTLGVSYGFQTTSASSHPTRLGHIYLADQFNTYIDWLIRSNPDAFRDAVYVNTEYTRQ